MKKLGIKFLIYRPVIDYEESETAYFICDDEETAKAVVECIVTFAKRLAARLPQHPEDDVTDEGFELWQAVEDKRQAIIARARWPFGLDLKSDIPSMGKTFDASTVEYRPLPVIGGAK